MELKMRVLQTARELGYLTDLHDRDRSEDLTAVTVLVPERIMSYEDNDHFLFYHDLIWGLEKRLREEGFSAVILRISHEMEENGLLPELAHSIPARGCILFGIAHHEYSAMVQKRLGPVLMFDSYYRDIPSPVVASANLEGAYEAVRYLIDCGHRSIGFIGPTNLTTSHEERWFGYWKAMTENEIPVNPQLTLLKSEGFHATEREIDSFLDVTAERPTAFFCGNDRIALMLIGALKQRGIRVPSDISVIGFDGLPQSSASEPPLTTMKVDKEGMCEAAKQQSSMGGMM
jgi:DNA-binding LacI/PurR family transcriptional regulator